MLQRLACRQLPERTANWIGYGYFAGNALIGPTLGNFTDLCQLPLAVFALMLGVLERRRWLIATSALLIPMIREDTGVLLVAVGLWVLIRHRGRWPMALMLIIWGGGWVLICTNLLMPLFSDDNAKRFMVENFGQYLGDSANEGSSSLGVGGGPPRARVNGPRRECEWGVDEAWNELRACVLGATRSWLVSRNL